MIHVVQYALARLSLHLLSYETWNPLLLRLKRLNILSLSVKSHLTRQQIE